MKDEEKLLLMLSAIANTTLKRRIWVIYLIRMEAHLPFWPPLISNRDGNLSLSLSLPSAPKQKLCLNTSWISIGYQHLCMDPASSVRNPIHAWVRFIGGRWTSPIVERKLKYGRPSHSERLSHHAAEQLPKDPNKRGPPELINHLSFSFLFQLFPKYSRRAAILNLFSIASHMPHSSSFLFAIARQCLCSNCTQLVDKDLENVRIACFDPLPSSPLTTTCSLHKAFIIAIENRSFVAVRKDYVKTAAVNQLTGDFSSSFIAPSINFRCDKKYIIISFWRRRSGPIYVGN